MVPLVARFFGLALGVFLVYGYVDIRLVALIVGTWLLALRYGWLRTAGATEATTTIALPALYLVKSKNEKVVEFRRLYDRFQKAVDVEAAFLLRERVWEVLDSLEFNLVTEKEYGRYVNETKEAMDKQLAVLIQAQNLNLDDCMIRPSCSFS